MRDKSIARWWIFLAILSGIGAAYLVIASATFLSIPLALAVISLILAVKYFARGNKACAEATSMPLLKRVAIVHERRSETTYKGSKGKTDYYFQLEFADGGKGEFRQPGKGPQFEPLVNGNTGMAYTRGQELLEFKVLRV